MRDTKPTWFDDGERFFTFQGSVVYIYSKDVIQEVVTVIPSPVGVSTFGGHGDFFWRKHPNLNDLDLYSMASPDTILASYVGYGSLARIGETLMIRGAEDPTIRIVHLDAAGVTET